MTEGNVLYYGDNLDVLRRHVQNESVDLVYLDPPFNSNADYNILFSERGEKAAAQVQAFTDTWTWDTDARRDYEEIVEAGGRVADTMHAFYTMLGGSDMMAYLARMSLRLVELHRVLRLSGSLYLHCSDPRTSSTKLCGSGPRQRDLRQPDCPGVTMSFLRSPRTHHAPSGTLSTCRMTPNAPLPSIRCVTRTDAPSS
jgi:hypothetical protein